MANRSALLDLPVEIHLEICDNLSLHALRPFTSSQPWGVITTFDSCAPGSFILKGLSQSCKYFRRITFPLRYQRVWLSVDRLDAFISIIKHFTLYPERGDFVKHLMIDIPPFVSTPASRPENETQELQQEARRLGLRFDSDNVNQNLEGFLIDMVLCQLQGIRRLNLEQWPVVEDQVRDETARGIIYGAHLPGSLVFPSLQHLTTEHPGLIDRPVQRFKRTLESLLRRAPSLTSLKNTGLVQEPFGFIQVNMPELRNLIFIANKDEFHRADRLTSWFPQWTKYVKHLTIYDAYDGVSNEAFFSISKVDAIKSHLVSTLLPKFPAFTTLHLVLGVWPETTNWDLIGEDRPFDIPQGIEVLMPP
ncbi:hypothetical protein B0J18DRAFT_465304 [Chaetomium sp. MPI-SDFR-AT-0129]|nr:hypothetical protein B0J18DRAFT_465304 [Chaetomium sp. MPI-SDFR-AT-0129]